LIVPEHTPFVSGLLISVPKNERSFSCLIVAGSKCQAGTTDLSKYVFTVVQLVLIK
jgi:hypothetical protein